MKNPFPLFQRIGVFLLILSIVGVNVTEGQSTKMDSNPLSGEEVENFIPPPMGWNSWNKFRCYDVSERVIMETADAMVENGMKDAGYQYIIIDDCWQAFSRDNEGNLRSNKERFPNGIKKLADYVHERGLKLGIYSAPGSQTCAMYWDKYPAEGIGSYNHEEQDAQQFADWGIDYLKYDWCRADINDGIKPQEAFKKMSDALKATGRPIFYGVHGGENPWEWAPAFANMWRTTSDIRANWPKMISGLDQEVGLERYAGSGHWNDPDMMQVGNKETSWEQDTGLTMTENITHFSLWAMLAAPLIAGNDIRDMDPEILEILTNKAVINVDQDSLGIQGRKIMDSGDEEVWIKPLFDGSVAVLLLNRGPGEAFMTVPMDQIKLPQGARQYKVNDLWTHETWNTDYLIRSSVPSHGVSMYRVWAK